ncbi:hypothetical protein B0H11DRAFT_2204125 [Mycena galericulata]|nr:hypothetical protein B0H11DRAFT_2204125 [Mycena galericulata]
MFFANRAIRSSAAAAWSEAWTLAWRDLPLSLELAHSYAWQAVVDHGGRPRSVIKLQLPNYHGEQERTEAEFFLIIGHSRVLAIPFATSHKDPKSRISDGIEGEGEEAVVGQGGRPHPFMTRSGEVQREAGTKEAECWTLAGSPRAVASPVRGMSSSRGSRRTADPSRTSLQISAATGKLQPLKSLLFKFPLCTSANTGIVSQIAARLKFKLLALDQAHP